MYMIYSVYYTAYSITKQHKKAGKVKKKHSIGRRNNEQIEKFGIDYDKSENKERQANGKQRITLQQRRIRQQRSHATFSW